MKVLPDNVGCDTLGGDFWLITRENTQQQPKQNSTGPQQIHGQESGTEMNSRSRGENSVAGRTKTLADLRRVATLINLRKRHELRRPAYKYHSMAESQSHRIKTVSRQGNHLIQQRANIIRRGQQPENVRRLTTVSLNASKI